MSIPKTTGIRERSFQFALRAVELFRRIQMKEVDELIAILTKIIIKAERNASTNDRP